MSLILNKYRFKRRLGGGAFGDVQLVSDEKENDIAIKMISKQIIAKDPFMEEYIEGEKDCMMKMNSQYVVKLYGVQEDESYKYFVCEYCNGGDLQCLQAKQTNKVFSLSDSVKILSQVLLGLQHVHRNAYLHRDIKLQNILVQKTSKGNVFKLADFGFSKRLQNINGTVLGTESFMSPQIYLNQSYGFEVDMWAFGVVFYFMLNMQFPFNLNPHMSLQEKIQSLIKQSKNFSYEAKVKSSNKKIYQNCSAQMEDLFKKMFISEPNKRINFSELRQHPIFKPYFPRFDKDLAEMYQVNLSSDKYSSFKMSRLSGNNTITNQQKKSVKPSQDIFSTTPSCFLKRPKTSEQNETVELEFDKINFLKDAAEQISLNLNCAEAYQIMAFRFSCFKYHVILLRNFISNFNEGYYKKTEPKLNWNAYFQSKQSKKMGQQIQNELLDAEMKVSQTYDFCRSQLEAIDIFNPQFKHHFEREVEEVDFATLKKSYRTSTMKLFQKLRLKKPSTIQITYYSFLVFMVHSFNNIVITTEADLAEMFKDFKKKYQGQKFDFRFFKGWCSRLSIEEIEKLILSLNRAYFGGQ